MRRNPAAFAILVGGGIAGACDITYAIVFSAFHGVAPLRILQSVASGLLGKPAFDGGIPVGILGLALHFAMTTLMAAIFWFASRRLPLLARHYVPAGLAYGLLIYLAMNFVVLPLSAWPGKFNPDLTLLVFNLIVHMGLVGLSIAWATHKAAPAAAA